MNEESKVKEEVQEDVKDEECQSGCDECGECEEDERATRKQWSREAREKMEAVCDFIREKFGPNAGFILTLESGHGHHQAIQKVSNIDIVATIFALRETLEEKSPGAYKELAEGFKLGRKSGIPAFATARMIKKGPPPGFLKGLLGGPGGGLLDALLGGKMKGVAIPGDSPQGHSLLDALRGIDPGLDEVLDEVKADLDESKESEAMEEAISHDETADAPEAAPEAESTPGQD